MLCRAAKNPRQRAARRQCPLLSCHAAPSHTSPLPPPSSADYTLSKGDVYWVTITQLLEWMQHPVPASRLRLSGALCGMAPSPPPPAPSPPPPMPMPNAGINITFVFEGA